jgi:AcrR family transcriptional regulator
MSKLRDAAKQETREALIRAATELFAARGLDRPSLDEICDHAGYTRGAFYVHFRDRDAITTAVMERVGGELLNALLGTEREHKQQPPDLPEIAKRFLSALASGQYPLTRKGGVRPYQLLDACARSPRILAQYRALVSDGLERLGRAVQAGQKRRAVRSDVDDDQVALVLMAAVIGAQTLLDLDVPMNLPAAGATLLKLLTPRTGASRR